MGQAVERLLIEGATLVEDHRLLRLAGMLEALALIEVLAQREQGAQLAGQRPQDHRRLDAFSPQPEHDATTALDFPLQTRIGQREDIIAGIVLDALDDGIAIQACARRVQQCELLQLLIRGQQIALDALGQQASGVLIQLEAVTTGAVANPEAEAGMVHRPHRDEDADLLQCLEPRRLLHLAIETRCGDQQDVAILLDALGVGLEDLAAFLAGTLGAHAQLDQLARGEQ